MAVLFCLLFMHLSAPTRRHSLRFGTAVTSYLGALQVSSAVSAMAPKKKAGAAPAAAPAPAPAKPQWRGNIDRCECSLSRISYPTLLGRQCVHAPSLLADITLGDLPFELRRISSTLIFLRWCYAQPPLSPVSSRVPCSGAVQNPRYERGYFTFVPSDRLPSTFWHLVTCASSLLQSFRVHLSLSLPLLQLISLKLRPCAASCSPGCR